MPTYYNDKSLSFFPAYTNELPEIYTRIAKFLTTHEILELGKVNPFMHRAMLSPKVWVDKIKQDFNVQLKLNKHYLAYPNLAKLLYTLFTLHKQVELMTYENNHLAKAKITAICLEMKAIIHTIETEVTTHEDLASWLGYFKATIEYQAGNYHNTYTQLLDAKQNDKCLYELLSVMPGDKLCQGFNEQVEQVYPELIALGLQQKENSVIYLRALFAQAYLKQDKDLHDYENMMLALDNGEELAVAKLHHHSNSFLEVITGLKEHQTGGELDRVNYYLQVLEKGAKETPYHYCLLASYYISGKISGRVTCPQDIQKALRYALMSKDKATSAVILADYSPLNNRDEVPLEVAYRAINSGFNRGSAACGLYLAKVYFYGCAELNIAADLSKAWSLGLTASILDATVGKDFIDFMLNDDNSEHLSIEHYKAFLKHNLASIELSPKVVAHNISYYLESTHTNTDSAKQLSEQLIQVASGQTEFTANLRERAANLVEGLFAVHNISLNFLS